LRELHLAEHGQLQPSWPQQVPILRFCDWQVGDLVVRFGFGHGTLVSFIDRAIWFASSVECFAKPERTQRVLKIRVNFVECGPVVCLFPQSRNLRVYLRG
jgi:hypothetical protein